MILLIQFIVLVFWDGMSSGLTRPRCLQGPVQYAVNFYRERRPSATSQPRHSVVNDDSDASAAHFGYLTVPQLALLSEDASVYNAAVDAQSGSGSHASSSSYSYRPHGCNYCNKRFINTSHLRDHLRLHTGERPYKCQACNRTFVQRQHLRQHELRASCTPHSCSVCSCVFPDQLSVIQHMRDEHA